MGGKRKIEEDYRKLANKHQIKWIGEFPPTVLHKTLWECGRGHRYMSKYNTIQQNGGSCPDCAAIKSRLRPHKYHDLAAQRNATWIGKSPKDTHQNTLWKCKDCEHQWMASYNYLLYSSSGCPSCAKERWLERYRFKATNYVKLGEKRKFLWHGPEVPNIHTKTLWEGECQHRWWATFKSIQRGTGCPICALGERRHTPDDYTALGQKNGHVWIGGPEVPHNVHVKTEWQCKQKHKFWSTYNNILAGQKCPYCIDRINGYQVSRPQRKLCEMVNGELNYPCGSYRIDVALPKEKIAIEYDCWFWHGPKQERDIRRDKDLLVAGWKVLHIRTNLSLPTQEELHDALDELRNGKKKAEIVLGDWGKGKTFVDVKKALDDKPPYFQLELF